jgi:hypothetical protein
MSLTIDSSLTKSNRIKWFSLIPRQSKNGIFTVTGLFALHSNVFARRLNGRSKWKSMLSSSRFGGTFFLSDSSITDTYSEEVGRLCERVARLRLLLPERVLHISVQFSRSCWIDSRSNSATKNAGLVGGTWCAILIGISTTVVISNHRGALVVRANKNRHRLSASWQNRIHQERKRRRVNK